MSSKKYYHASTVPITSKTITPKNYYEAINPAYDCPTPIQDVRFPISKIKETAFSKSMEASVIAIARHCHFQSCNVYIYETKDEPDVDISDCGFDFEMLEEVRYRRTVPIKFVKKIHVPARIISDIDDLYQQAVDLETGSLPLASGLRRGEGKIKEDIRKL